MADRVLARTINAHVVLARAHIAARAAVVPVRGGVDAHAAAGDKRQLAVICDAHAQVAVRRRFWADIATRAAIVGVAGEIDARIPAQHQTRRAGAARARVAVRSPLGTDVPAPAAVVGIGPQVRARSAAVGCAIDASVEAVPIEAFAVLIGTSLIAHMAAGPAVVEVIGQIGAGVAASARTTETAGIGIARTTRGQTPILLSFVATPAKRFAEVGGGGPGRFQP